MDKKIKAIEKTVHKDAKKEMKSLKNLEKEDKKRDKIISNAAQKKRK